MSILIGLIPFSILIGIYIYSRLSGRLQAEPMEKDRKDTSSAKIFHSKVQEMAFFDGASEQYTEALSRLRQYGGG